MVCYKIHPFGSITCSQVGPMSVEWPVAPTGGLDQPGLSLPREDANGEHLESTHPAPPHLRWRRDALQPPGVQRTRSSRNTCVTPQLSRKKKHNYFTRLTKNNDIICLQEIHWKKEFPQAIQVLAPKFRLYGTFIPNNSNAGGSPVCIHKNLVPEGANVTHVVPCQGRDHIVKIQSGDRNLVVVNIHFEPDLTLRNLRE